MGIKCGITLIAGGGFHGKSTLLQALEAGVYDKVSSARSCVSAVVSVVVSSCLRRVSDT